jgi:phosphoribosylglycinamide formyltransferase-1
MVTKRPCAIVISGGGSNMAALLTAMAGPEYPARCVLVASNRPEAGGLAKAAAAGVPTAVEDHRAHSDRDAFDRALAARLDASGAELIVLAGFMRLLTPWFVDRYRDRLVNIHPALLPSFRGLHTHAAALAEGCAVHGCTVHLVRHEVDAGPILGQGVVPVLAADTPDTLAARVLRMEHRLYPNALAAYARGDLRMADGRLLGQPLALMDPGT